MVLVKCEQSPSGIKIFFIKVWFLFNNDLTSCNTRFPLQRLSLTLCHGCWTVQLHCCSVKKRERQLTYLSKYIRNKMSVIVGTVLISD